MSLSATSTLIEWPLAESDVKGKDFKRVDLKLKESSLDIRKKSFTERVVRPW